MLRYYVALYGNKDFFKRFKNRKVLKNITLYFRYCTLTGRYITNEPKAGPLILTNRKANEKEVF